MKKQFRVVALLASTLFQCSAGPAMLTQNDFLPLSSTDYPLIFLNDEAKRAIRKQVDNNSQKHILLASSVVCQKASTGTNLKGVSLPAPVSPAFNTLGDFRGRRNMLALLYGNLPIGAVMPTQLALAAGQLYQDNVALTNSTHGRDSGSTGDNFGRLSTQIKYKKMAARGQFSFCISDFVFTVEGGIADIQQASIAFTDQTALATAVASVYGASSVPGFPLITTTTADVATVDTFLIAKKQQIFDEIGLNVQDFHETGAEDVFVSLVWRHNFRLNKKYEAVLEDEIPTFENEEWEPFVLTPFFKVTGMLGIGKEQDPAFAFSLPFGNNGHHGVSVSSGFSLDFPHTLELSWEAGASHFFKRDISGLFVPNNEFQSGVYPFKANVSYDPGKTWFFRMGMYSYHFLDKLTCFAQYLFTKHSQDSITLLKADPAFVPKTLEDTTPWTVQAANVGFSYDLAPSMRFGFAWQAPLTGRGAYNSTTIMFSLVGTF